MRTAKAALEERALTAQFSVARIDGLLASLKHAGQSSPLCFVAPFTPFVQ